MSSYLVESGGVEPHPVLHKDLVFKTSRGTNSPASLSMFGGPKGIRTPADGVTSRCTDQAILWDLKLAPQTGIEPA